MRKDYKYSAAMQSSDFELINSIDEIVGNRFQIEKMKAFAKDINTGKQREPLLIWGPTGIGKTLSAYLLAKWAGWSVIESNAGDIRGADALDKRTAPSSTSRNLFGSRNMILLDEIDEISKSNDQGAAAAITKIINNSKSPIIMIANNMWSQNLSFLRGKVEAIKFSSLTNLEVQKLLNMLCTRNGIKLTPKLIESISVRAAGDARSAINDAVALDGATEDSIDVVGLRDRKSEVFLALDRIFMSNTYSAPLRSLAISDVETEMMIKWIDENIPNRYSEMSEIRSAYKSLSKGTTFSSRASISHYYNYLRYMSALISSGVSLSKNGRPNTIKGYAFPKVIKLLSSTKTDRGSGTIIAKKLRRKVHSSSRYIKSTIMPLLSLMAKNAMENGSTKEEIFDFFAAKFNIDEKESEYIINAKYGSPAL